MVLLMGKDFIGGRERKTESMRKVRGIWKSLEQREKVVD